MGKIEFKIVLLLLVFAMGGLYAEGEVFSENDFKYTVENGTATITEYYGDAEKILIPKKLGEYNVTNIGNNAFWGCESLTSIEIPDSVTSIGYGAFYECKSLITLEISDSVTNIGYGAFSYSGLTSIKLNENHPMYRFVEGVLFDKAKSVLHTYLRSNKRTSYVIPDSVISIGNSAFSGCESLTSIEIPDSVTSIGKLAFYECKSLTTLEIPNSVTSIGGAAFYACESLTTVKIPDSVTRIEGSTFGQCGGLTSIEIGNSVTNIGSYAFQECYRLATIEIPDLVTSIEEATFYYCASLTTLKIPDSVTSIGKRAFQGCSSLRTLEIPDSVTRIGSKAFESTYLLMQLYRTTDNLRLREEEGTGGNILFTLSRNTSVKIIARGKEERIDSITARWVQVEVQKDTVDTQGERIKAGTVGWCFGGYLDWHQ